tara:strand:+ start:293 stop:433 length:141 start_codon:yes stop_codon:yes gene_type:complete
MSTYQRQQFILKNIKAKGIEVRSGVPDKKMIVKRFTIQSILLSFPE